MSFVEAVEIRNSPPDKCQLLVPCKGQVDCQVPIKSWQKWLMIWTWRAMWWLVSPPCVAVVVVLVYLYFMPCAVLARLLWKGLKLTCPSSLVAPTFSVPCLNSILHHWFSLVLWLLSLLWHRSATVKRLNLVFHRKKNVSGVPCIFLLFNLATNNCSWQVCPLFVYARIFIFI